MAMDQPSVFIPQFPGFKLQDCFSFEDSPQQSWTPPQLAVLNRPFLHPLCLTSCVGPLPATTEQATCCIPLECLVCLELW